MKFLYLWMLLFLTSCSSFPREPKVDNELLIYAEEFTKIMDKPSITERMSKSEIYFEKMKSETRIGNCSNWNITYSVITIDPDWWVKATPMGKQFVVYHELGHCLCYRLHTEESSGWERWLEKAGFALGIMKRKDVLEDGCPASIMHPNTFSEYCMLVHYFYYLKELKKGCQ